MPSSPNPSLTASLANAIANQEGYGASATNKPTRTNNPGDLGNTDNGSTATYPTADAGWAALDNQVNLFLTGEGDTIYNPSMTLAQIGAHYASDPNWATSVSSQLGVSPDTKMSDLVDGTVPFNNVPRPGSPSTSTGGAPVQSVNTNTASTAASTQGVYYGVNDAAAVATVPIAGSTLSAQQAYSALQAANPSLIITAGIYNTPWFSDSNILQVDGATSGIPTPITFQIYFDLNSSPVPILLELNASLTTMERSLRHVINRQPTRTGYLLSFWGMQPDQITGSGSTGLFANQLGVTDFLSVSQLTSDVAAILQSGFAYENGTVSQILGDGTSPSLSLNDGAFRIAAKDAFVEFLALFKNNGSVWYQNESYTGYTTQQTQSAPNIWSTATGSTTVQNAGRRNDVLTRGGVAMSFRNSTYFGYFKSLSWQMDADKPFQWNFDFVFQVERTVTSVPIPCPY